MAAEAIITAGGSGLRFGRKKQFFSIGGIPILRRAVDCFDRHPLIDRIVVAAPLEDLEHTRAMLEGVRKPIELTAGGRTRQESVGNALALCSPEGLILIHDGVRPLVTEGLITRVIEGVAGFDACIPGLAVSNTLKEVEGDLVARTVPRSKLFGVQTPQCFRAEVIRRAHEAAAARGFLDATDDSALVEDLGGKVRLVEGDPNNIKITVAEDIAIAEALLRCRSESA
jgi:2-C-methyl-D-erythritol 4-phosphate cytidylyltransferase